MLYGEKNEKLLDRIRQEGALVWATAQTTGDLRAAFLAGQMAQKVDEYNSDWPLTFWYDWHADDIRELMYRDDEA